MRDLRILSLSFRPSGDMYGNTEKPYLLVQGAGNDGSNYSWFLYDKLGHIDDHGREQYTEAIAENRLLFVAGMNRDVNENYIRASGSSSCKDVDDGCLWTNMSFFVSGVHQGTGTSLSTPNVAASLAAILSIFPDTSHQNLAKLARACAKKAGEGIDGPNGLLATSGGFGVADFSCMDEITAASADLSGDETAILTVDGRRVVVSSRSITVTE